MENNNDNERLQTDGVQASAQQKSTRKAREPFFTAKNITRVAVFGVLSFVLYMFVKFPMPFIFPEFLDMQISDMPALLAGFMMGPTAGCVVLFVRALLKLPFSTTMYAGELFDLLGGLAMVIPASFVYKKFRSKKGALAALGIGSAVYLAASLLVNAFLVIPFYVKFMFGGNWDILLNAMRTLFPAITKANFYAYYLPLSVLPFNILRIFLSSLVTFLVYKQTEKIFNRLFSQKSAQRKSAKQRR